MSNAKTEEEDLLSTICRSHNIQPHYLRQLFQIEKEYADKNMGKRRGIHDRISNMIMEWIEDEEEGSSVL